MTAYTPRAPHREDRSATSPSRDGLIPHVRNRIGALIAVAGLGAALLSLYLPWLSTDGGGQITAIGITEIIDVRGVAPVLFLGLVLMSFLVAVTTVTRLGAFAYASAIVALAVLAAHLAFVWTLGSSTGSADPILAGLPSDASVTFGPYVAALGFVLVAAGSVWAARAADYLFPDVEAGRHLRD